MHKHDKKAKTLVFSDNLIIQTFIKHPGEKLSSVCTSSLSLMCCFTSPMPTDSFCNLASGNYPREITWRRKFILTANTAWWQRETFIMKHFAQEMHNVLWNSREPRDSRTCCVYWLVLSCCQSSVTQGLTVSTVIKKVFPWWGGLTHWLWMTDKITVDKPFRT